jgi:hypothetical protein
MAKRPAKERKKREIVLPQMGRMNTDDSFVNYRLAIAILKVAAFGHIWLHWLCF